jgi:hypothetical protein
MQDPDNLEFPEDRHKWLRQFPTYKSNHFPSLREVKISDQAVEFWDGQLAPWTPPEDLSQLYEEVQIELEVNVLINVGRV